MEKLSTSSSSSSFSSLRGRSHGLACSDWNCMRQTLFAFTIARRLSSVVFRSRHPDMNNTLRCRETWLVRVQSENLRGHRSWRFAETSTESCVVWALIVTQSLKPICQWWSEALRMCRLSRVEDGRHLVFCRWTWQGGCLILLNYWFDWLSRGIFSLGSRSHQLLSCLGCSLGVRWALSAFHLTWWWVERVSSWPDNSSHQCTRIPQKPEIVSILIEMPFGSEQYLSSRIAALTIDLNIWNICNYLTRLKFPWYWFPPFKYHFSIRVSDEFFPLRYVGPFLSLYQKGDPFRGFSIVCQHESRVRVRVAYTNKRRSLWEPRILWRDPLDCGLTLKKRRRSFCEGCTF